MAREEGGGVQFSDISSERESESLEFQRHFSSTKLHIFTYLKKQSQAPKENVASMPKQITNTRYQQEYI